MQDNTPNRTRLRSFRAFTFLIYFGLVIIALLVTGALSYRQNQVALLSFIEDTNQEYVEQTGRLLDSILYETSYSSAALVQHASVAAFLRQAPTDESERASEAVVESLLRFVINASRHASTSYVFSTVRDRIASDRGTVDVAVHHDSDWLSRLPDIAPNSPIVEYRRGATFQEDLVSIVRRIDSSEDLIGAIVINLPIAALRRTLGSPRIDGAEDFLIISHDGSVLFSFDDDVLSLDRTVVVPETTPFIQESQSQLFGLTYVVSRGEAAFEENIETLGRYLAVLVVTVSLVGSVLTVALSCIAYRPIREIVATIEDPSHAGKAIWSKDVQFIENTIVQSIASNRELEGRLADRIENLHEATYIALQLQLNPHFLHNTLESLYWSSLDSAPPDSAVPRSLLSLSRMLRLVLDAEEMAVPLRSEIELTNHYVDILTVRFPGRVAVEWEVPNSLLSRTVPKLLLQPLVENAFYHGIKPLKRPGRIRIECRELDEEMVIAVHDDGTGMDADRLKHLQSEMKQEMRIVSQHIGVLNVAQRVRILFGERGELTIDSSPGDGTSVIVRVPDQPAVAIG